jgi:hypothetical protein
VRPPSSRPPPPCTAAGAKRVAVSARFWSHRRAGRSLWGCIPDNCVHGRRMARMAEVLAWIRAINRWGVPAGSRPRCSSWHPLSVEHAAALPPTSTSALRCQPKPVFMSGRGPHLQGVRLRQHEPIRAKPPARRGPHGAHRQRACLRQRRARGRRACERGAFDAKRARESLLQLVKGLVVDLGQAEKVQAGDELIAPAQHMPYVPVDVPRPATACASCDFPCTWWAPVRHVTAGILLPVVASA